MPPAVAPAAASGRTSRTLQTILVSVVLCGAAVALFSGLNNAPTSRRAEFHPVGFSSSRRERWRQARQEAAAAAAANKSFNRRRYRAPAVDAQESPPSLLPSPPPAPSSEAELAPATSRANEAAPRETGFTQTPRDFSTAPSFSATQHYARSLRRGAANRLTRHKDVCIDYQGRGGSGASTSGPKLGDAWLCGAGQRGTRPSLRLTRNLLWRPERASARTCDGGLTWLVDVSHGPSRSWSNICHWADSMYPFFSALHDMHADASEGGGEDGARLPPLQQIALPQVPTRAQFLSPRGAFSDWFSKTMNVVLTYHNGVPLQNYSSLLYQADFRRTLCFAELATAEVDFMAPHFYSARAAHSWRDATVAFLQMPPLLPAGAPGGPTQTTLLLRTSDRMFTNEPQLIAGLESLLRAEGRPPPEVVRLKGTLPFRWQVAMYANTSLLISPHGAQLTNVVFMPDDAAVIEMLTCGYYSDTYRKFAVESGLYYIASRDPGPGCDADLGKKHHNDNRPVSMRELRPVVVRALHRFSKSSPP